MAPEMVGPSTFTEVETALPPQSVSGKEDHHEDSKGKEVAFAADIAHLKSLEAEAEMSITF